MNRTNGPFVLTLPSVKDNLSSASAPSLPGSPPENHANNDQGSTQ